jgi:hypothetical protein
MMDDGVKEKHRDEEVKVQDIAEVLAEAVERADADRAGTHPATNLTPGG